MLDLDLLLFIYKQNMGFRPLQSQNRLPVFCSLSNACRARESVPFSQYLLLHPSPLNKLLPLLHLFRRRRTGSSSVNMEEQLKQLDRSIKVMEFCRPNSLQLVWNPMRLQQESGENKLEIFRFARPIAFKLSVPQELKHTHPFIFKSNRFDPKRAW